MTISLKKRNAANWSRVRINVASKGDDYTACVDQLIDKSKPPLVGYRGVPPGETTVGVKSPEFVHTYSAFCGRVCEPLLMKSVAIE